MKTLRDLGDIEERRVLVRVDFNVPLDGREVADDTRIRAALPTLEQLRERHGRLVLVSHLGRPRDREPELSMRPAADRLAELTDADVTLAPSVVGEEVRSFTENLGPGEILMLENVRYEPGETRNDPELSAALAELADAYVNDAFGAAHRAHSSTEGVARLLQDHAAGLLLEREVTVLSKLLEDPARPLVAVLGGAKVSDKLGVIERFLSLADTILIGGAMCFPFFAAQGHGVGASLCEDDDVKLARGILEAAGDAHADLRLPVDLVIADRLAAEASSRELDGLDVPEGWMGLDIGPRTALDYAEAIADAGTVFWNGPMGAFELDAFAAGTRTIAEAVATAPGTTIAGRRRLRRGAAAVRAGRPAHAHLDGRRGRARADRGAQAAGSGGAEMSAGGAGAAGADAPVARRPFVAANWKMHKTVAEAEAFVAALLPSVSTCRWHGRGGLSGVSGPPGGGRLRARLARGRLRPEHALRTQGRLHR